jgi:hypothetical protein
MSQLSWLATLLLNLLGGAVGAAVLLGVLWKTLGRIWTDRLRLEIELKNNTTLETKKAELQIQTGKELESLKDQLGQQSNRTQKLLEAHIDKAVLVTRTHFETEFSAYKDLYAALCEVKYAIFSTRPQMKIVSENETEADRLKALQESFTRLEQTHNDLIRLKENLMPFYSADVYTQISECLRASGREITDIKLANERRFRHDWWQEGERRQADFSAAFGRVGELIRERIASLGILPS